MVKKFYCSTAGYKYVHVSVLTDLSRFRPVYAPKDFLEVSPVSFFYLFYSVVMCMDCKQLSPCCQQLSIPVIELILAGPQCYQSMFNNFLFPWQSKLEEILSFSDIVVRHIGVDQPAKPESQQQRGCWHQKPLGPHSSPAQCPGHPTTGR